jgi:hypothetical protein
MTNFAQIHPAHITPSLEWFETGASSACAIDGELAIAFAAACPFATGTLVGAAACPMSCHAALEANITPLATAGTCSTSTTLSGARWSWHRTIRSLALLLIHPLEEVALSGWT